MILSSTELFKIKNSENIANANQISSFISENNEKIFGSENKVYLTDSIAVGTNCIAGAKYWQFRLCDNENKIFTLMTHDEKYLPKDISGELSVEFNDLSNIIGKKYSKQSYNKTYDMNYVAVEIGTVLSVFDINKISVDYLPAAGTCEDCVSELKPASKNYCQIWITGAEQYGNFSVGQDLFAQGYKSSSYKTCAVAEGCECKALGKYAHAEGNTTLAGHAAHSEGEQTKAYGGRSHAEGYSTVAGQMPWEQMYDVYAAHSEGCVTSAFGRCSHSEGVRSVVSDDISFSWNGNNGNYTASVGELSDLYFSHGAGTFNINPKNNLSGFYIGEKSLEQIFQQKFYEFLQSSSLYKYFDYRTYVPGIYEHGGYVFQANSVGYSDDQSSPSYIIRNNIDPVITELMTNSVYKIEDGTVDQSFAVNSNLEKIHCQNLSSIGAHAFYKNQKLTEVYSPQTTNIKDRAFEYCSNIQTLKFDSLSSLGTVPFSGCSNVKFIYVKNEKCESIENDTILIEKGSNGISSILAIAPNNEIISTDIVCKLPSVKIYYYPNSLVKEIHFPNVTTIEGTQNIYMVSNLSLLNIANVQNINATQIIRGSYKLNTIDFSKRNLDNGIPTLKNTTAFNSYIISNDKTYLVDTLSILVPSALYDDWISADNWNGQISVTHQIKPDTEKRVDYLSNYIHGV